jgi:hypothetical protein
MPKGESLMREYQVQIKEYHTMTVTIEAQSAAQAREIVEQRYNNSDYTLDADHFQGVLFVSPKNWDLER